jgi:hypothetical protein
LSKFRGWNSHKLLKELKVTMKEQNLRKGKKVSMNLGEDREERKNNFNQDLARIMYKKREIYPVTP